MGLPEICGQQNVKATARDNTGQNTKDMPSTKIEIKTPDPTKTQSQAARLECRDSTDHITAADISTEAYLYYFKY